MISVAGVFVAVDPALTDILDRFHHHLVATGKSPHTVEAYVRDVRLFAEWFTETNGKSLSPEGITPIDVRQYRSHLLTVKSYKPATVDRKLASLSALFDWARQAELIPADPTEEISPVDEVSSLPNLC